MSVAPASNPRRRRILLLSYYYPPDTAVGAVRPARLAAALRERGHDVHVIAAGETNSFDDATGVDRVRPLPNPREWWLRYRHLVRKGEAEAGSVEAQSIGGYAAPENISAWKRWLFSLLWTPDDRQGFIWPTVRRAMWASESAPFDLIYTSAPPFSVHLAGLLLKQRLGLPWIAEFRDPWMDGARRGAYTRSRLMDALELRMERACLTEADQVVAVTHGAADAISSKRTTAGRPAPLVVLNGIDEIHESRAARAERPLRVLYLGTLYYGRDPRPLFNALAELRRSRRLPAGEFQFLFVGHCRWFHEHSVRELASQAGIEDVVSIHDPVSQVEAQSLLLEADVLLLLAQRQPDQVPHKLYEYLGAARPILAFVDEEGESARMLRHVGGHHLVTETMSVDATAERVAAALTDATKGWTVDTEKLVDWLTVHQMAKAVNLIEHLT
jgi:glycosyltransferase involved in cell wall biosynthesis